MDSSSTTGPRICYRREWIGAITVHAGDKAGLEAWFLEDSRGRFLFFVFFKIHSFGRDLGKRFGFRN
jgi:hypothetical protein